MSCNLAVKPWLTRCSYAKSFMTGLSRFMCGSSSRSGGPRHFKCAPCYACWSGGFYRLNTASCRSAGWTRWTNLSTWRSKRVSCRCYCQSTRGSGSYLRCNRRTHGLGCMKSCCHRRRTTGWSYLHRGFLQCRSGNGHFHYHYPRRWTWSPSCQW